MNISQEKIGDLNTIVTINIKPEDYQPRVEKAIKDQAKKAKLPGFRPGMVPPSHIKRMYGKSILVDEVNNLLSDTLNNYIAEQQLEVLGQPLPKLDDNKQYNWDKIRIRYFGHACILIETTGINILVDPLISYSRAHKLLTYGQANNSIHSSSETSISTLRFWALPSGVLLSPIGESDESPI